MTNEPYFIWNGIDSRNMGLVVSAYPPISMPEEKVQEFEIPGRDGTLHIADGSYKAVSMPCSCYVKPGTDLNALCRWLRGKGTVIFGKWPNRSREATVLAQISFQQIIRGYEWMTFTVPFVCLPYAHDEHYGELIEIQQSDDTIWNPGHYEVPAIVEVHGHFSELELTVGGIPVTLHDVEEGIDGMLLDWEAQDCYTLILEQDGSYTKLANGNTMVRIHQSAPTGAEQKLIEGFNTIRWSVTNGTVDGIYIRNNWRYYT